jgi:hypothetical protein
VELLLLFVKYFSTVFGPCLGILPVSCGNGFCFGYLDVLEGSRDLEIGFRYVMFGVKNVGSKL